MPLIQTMDSRFPDVGMETLLSHWWERANPGLTLRIPKAFALAPVQAFVNDGRWLVMCEVCNGAQEASRSDRRFLCVDCLNAGHGGLWRRVEWPRDAEAIEAVLSARPQVANRQWRPGETIRDLLAENREHGVN